MNTRMKCLAAGLGVATALAVAAPASATVVIKPVSSGVFDDSNPIGTILGLTVRKTNTYDFTFQLGDYLDTDIQMQASKAGGVALPISFSLFSGTPSTGTLLASSGYFYGPAIEQVLKPGWYYLQIDKIAQDKELVSGALSVASVPEPGVWALMIAGFGMVGAAARRRGRLQAA